MGHLQLYSTGLLFSVVPYLGGCRAWCPVARVTVWVYVVAGTLGRGALDDVNI